jgi:hypothetical protein
MALTNPEKPILSHMHHKPRKSRFPTPSFKIHKLSQTFNQPHQAQYEQTTVNYSELLTKYFKQNIVK